MGRNPVEVTDGAGWVRCEVGGVEERWVRMRGGKERVDVWGVNEGERLNILIERWVKTPLK